MISRLLIVAGILASSGAYARDAKVTASAKGPASAVAGKPFYLTVTLDVAKGFHIGGADAGKNQVATTIKVTAPDGVKVGTPLFPPSREEKLFGEMQKILDGSVTVRIPVTAAKSGACALKADVNYQACNDRLCDPPADVSAEATVKVTAAPKKSAPTKRHK
jgi:DsbC/DsbD-like thiol-disulfide interchange protein